MKRQRNAGFTLIEIMITLVIISVLSAIALPAYKDHVVRARLTEAFSALSTVQTSAEQFWANNRSYVGMSAVSGWPTASDNFTYSLDVATPSAYTVKATGIGKVTGFTYTIDQSGKRLTVSVGTGWTKTTKECWTDHKDGTCVQ